MLRPWSQQARQLTPRRGTVAHLGNRGCCLHIRVNLSTGEARILAFTRYCFTSKLYCGSQSSFHRPPNLQSLPYCNTVARPLRNMRPPTDPPLLGHTPYDIGDGNIVLRPTRIALQKKIEPDLGQRCPVRVSDSTIEFPNIQTTELLVKTRSGT